MASPWSWVGCNATHFLTKFGQLGNATRRLPRSRVKHSTHKSQQPDWFGPMEAFEKLSRNGASVRRAFSCSLESLQKVRAHNATEEIVCWVKW